MFGLSLLLRSKGLWAISGANIGLPLSSKVDMDLWERKKKSGKCKLLMKLILYN